MKTGFNGLPRVPRLAVSVPTVLLCVAVYIALFGNQRLWLRVGEIVNPGTTTGVGIFVSFFIFICAVLMLLMAPFGHRRVFKPVVILVLLVVSLVGWFEDSYGTIIDREIIRSAMETDAREAGEILSSGLFFHLLLTFVLPSLLILWFRIKYPRGVRSAFVSLATMLVACVAGLAALWAGYQNFSVLARDHNELRMLVNPTYAIYSLWSVMTESANADPAQLIEVGSDASQIGASSRKPRVVVFVLGETARADHFELNGYRRHTNPVLSQKPLINFPNVTSCGTATSVSLPCIFSSLSRGDFDVSKGSHYENILNVLDRAGVEVVWRENNTGCKGVCDGFQTEDFRESKDSRYCGVEGCVDEILLSGLEEVIDSRNRDLFIVLHQSGSHGPAYHRRYPRSFGSFQPECRKDEPRECSEDELVNSYDNSILYTDYFLGKVIELLESVSDTREATMVYVSDHGESLGEHGLYLHGLPWSIAPANQKQVPMVMWMNPDFEHAAPRFSDCVKASKDRHLSHDNVFHTILGLFDIRTRDRNESLDLTAACGAAKLAGD